MRRYKTCVLIAAVFFLATSCCNYQKPQVIERKLIEHYYESEFRPGPLPRHFTKPEPERKAPWRIPRPPKLNQLRAKYAFSGIEKFFD